MTYRIKKATEKDYGTIRKLHQQTFGGTAEMVSPDVGWWFIIWNGPTPVAFAGLTHGSRGANYGYFIRAGVLRSHRGHGLQRRLIKARLRQATELGLDYVVTDTTDNPWSGKNLQKSGFSPYEPREKWGLSNTIYWRKSLG